MLFRKNVFILGAGFTADAGAPVMKNFLQRSKYLLDNPDPSLPATDRDAFTRVFQFLRRLRAAQAKITLDLENIEHLFGLAEMDVEFGESTGGAFRRDLIFLILRTIENSIRSDLSRGGGVITKEGDKRWNRGVEAHYGELFAALASRKWLAGPQGIGPDGQCQDTIITMNYDCFLDEALARVAVSPDYGLPNAEYPEAWRGLPARISFLKLHGSANWLRCVSDLCNRKVWIWEGRQPDGRLGYFYGSVCPSCYRPIEPAIVPPTWAKGGQRDIFAPIWSRALQALQQAGRVFIIGYSMPETDAFFQYMLGLALATNENIDEVIVVNPNPEAHQRFLKLFQESFRDRRLRSIQLPAATFITSGGPSLGEILGQYAAGLDRQLIETTGFRVG
jgi:NAD-dependent SIR2 family protein deacetylase